MAVVTGGARGLGLAIAERLQDAGARVALWDRDGGAVSAAAARLGAHAEVVDVTDAASLAGALARSEAALGPCWAMVANAGISGTVFEDPAYGGGAGRSLSALADARTLPRPLSVLRLVEKRLAQLTPAALALAEEKLLRGRAL
jgi:NAD(P)-dependent dehydrogenase (short-subunit alcohol dehydrogenase family)